MAKIDLRAYYDEIESLINRGRYDEAIAHCRHILQVFPKSFQTYRLLGKAFLEARRYSDAVDIFQRVLSAVPSDFVSHLGLSIIREDEGNLDAAIWHMERAFEIQPYNGAIQEELRRLYDRRDGSSPPRIRLTRSALARMYAKGNLYQQAAAEARSILNSDPQRLDIQLILADMYYKSGKSVEAAEISSKVLNRLPYSLEANRILVRILENSEHREEYREYQDRLVTLDPYESRTSAEFQDASQVPSAVVQIDKLDLAGEQLVPADAPADWMTSLGLSSSDFETELDDELPDWLIAASEQIQQETAEQESLEGELTEPEDLLADSATDIDSIEWLGETEETGIAPADDLMPGETAEAEEEEAIPDWMLEAGWQERAEGTAEAPADEGEPFSFDFEETEDESESVAEADIPDWLRDLAPEDLAEDHEETVSEETEDEDLAALFDQQQDEDSGKGLTAAALAAAGLAAAGALFDEDEEEQPEEVSSEGEAAGEQVATQAEDADLAALSDQQYEDTGEGLPPAALAAAGLAAAGALFDEEEAEQPEEAGPADEVIGEQLGAESELPDWLQEFDQEDEGAKEAGAETIQAAPGETDIPEWLAAIDEGVYEDTADEIQDFPTETEVVDSVPETTIDESASAIDTELPDWLREFEEEPPATEAVEAETEQPQAAEISADELPDWLQEMEETPEEADEAAVIDPVSEAEAPEGGIELEEPPDFSDADDALAWLAGLAAGHELVDESEPETAEAEAPAAEVEIEAVDEYAAEVEVTAGEQAEADDQSIDAGFADDAQEEVELASPPDFEDMDEAVAWLEQLAENAPESPASETETVEAALPPEQEGTLEEAPVEPEMDAVELQPETTGEAVEAIDINKASLIEIERQPGVGFRVAQLIVAYRDSHGPFHSMDDLMDVPGIEPDDIFTLRDHFAVASPVGETAESVGRSAEPEDKTMLLQARQAASQGQLDEATSQYAQLVNDGKNLEDVIYDLNQILQQRPDNIELWQLVGDAYMRNNQLIEAMQAYNKAEELLH